VNDFGRFNLKRAPNHQTRIRLTIELFKNIYQNNTHAFLLESMESDSGMARFSVLGFQPSAIIKAHDNVLEIERNGTKEGYYVENPFDEIKKLISTSNGRKGFSGGLVGYVSYEAVKYFEPVEMARSPLS